MSVYAWLGDITLAMPEWADRLEVRRGHEFAEHQPVGQPPRLQSTGRGLDEIRLHAWVRGDTALDWLKAAMDEARVLALVFADGRYPGRYVITEITERRLLDVALGPKLIEVDLTLREHVETDPMAQMQDRQIQQAPGLKPQPPEGVRR